MEARLTSAIILVGGQSRRLGRNKAEVVIAGKSMLERVVGVITPLFDDIVLAGAAAKPPDVGKVRVVEDEIPGVGPLGGLYTGLGAVRNPRAFCVACDMPLITRKLIRQLLRTHTEAAAVVFRIGGKLQPLCAIYAKALRPLIQQQIEVGDYRLKGLLERIEPAFIDLADREDVRRILFNVNRPEDLARLRNIFGEQDGGEAGHQTGRAPPGR